MKRIQILIGFCLAAGSFLSAQKVQPDAMGSDYQPLLWRGPDAQFAVDTTHASLCESEVTRTVASTTSDAGLQHLVTQSASLQSGISKELKTLAKPTGFKLFDKKKPLACTDAERLASLHGEELDRAYIDYLGRSSSANIARFRGQAEAPPNSANFGLRKFANQTLNALYGQQRTLAAAKKKLEHAPAGQ